MPPPYYPAALVPLGQLLVAQNNKVADLSLDMDAFTSSLSVGTGQGIRFVVNESVVVDQEAMLITAIVGDVLTVNRGFDGTAISAHTSGPGKVADRPIAAHHNNPRYELYALLQALTARSAGGLGLQANLDANDKLIQFVADAVSPQDAVNLRTMDAAITAGGVGGRFTTAFLLMGA